MSFSLSVGGSKTGQWQAGPTSGLQLTQIITLLLYCRDVRQHVFLLRVVSPRKPFMLANGPRLVCFTRENNSKDASKGRYYTRTSFMRKRHNKKSQRMHSIFSDFDSCLGNEMSRSQSYLELTSMVGGRRRTPSPTASLPRSMRVTPETSHKWVQSRATLFPY